MKDYQVIVDNDRLSITCRQCGPYQTNCYIVTCQRTRESMIIDAPGDVDSVISMLNGVNPAYLILTHTHMDHTEGLLELKARLDPPLIVHERDTDTLQISPDITVHGDEELRLGKLDFQIMHTPGHTPGSICIIFDGYVLSGDTVFPGGPGKTWSPEDFKVIISSITQKLFLLPVDTVLLPGHGESITVGESRRQYELFAFRQHHDTLYGDVLWESS